MNLKPTEFFIVKIEDNSCITEVNIYAGGLVVFAKYAACRRKTARNKLKGESIELTEANVCTDAGPVFIPILLNFTPRYNNYCLFKAGIILK